MNRHDARCALNRAGLTLALCAAAASSGCRLASSARPQSPAISLELTSDTQVREEVLKWVPIGTPADDAAETMRRVENCKVTRLPADGDGPERLYCEITRKLHWILYDVEVWTILLELRDELVEDVVVSHGRTGL
jgi:hypothetical protein